MAPSAAPRQHFLQASAAPSRPALECRAAEPAVLPAADVHLAFARQLSLAPCCCPHDVHCLSACRQRILAATPAELATQEQSFRALLRSTLEQVRVGGWVGGRAGGYKCMLAAGSARVLRNCLPPPIHPSLLQWEADPRSRPRIERRLALLMATRVCATTAAATTAFVTLAMRLWPLPPLPSSSVDT